MTLTTNDLLQHHNTQPAQLLFFLNNGSFTGQVFSSGRSYCAGTV